jgi:hypothetical protein
MKKLGFFFLITTAMFTGCKDTDPVVDPIFAPVIVQGVTATFSAVAPASIKVGQTLTLSGTNFSTTLSDNLVVFTTQNSAVNVMAKTATASTITVDVPATAVTGLIAVKVKGVTAQMATGFGGNLTILP